MALQRAPMKSGMEKSLEHSAGLARFDLEVPVVRELEGETSVIGCLDSDEVCHRVGTKGKRQGPIYHQRYHRLQK